MFSTRVRITDPERRAFPARIPPLPPRTGPTTGAPRAGSPTSSSWYAAPTLPTHTRFFFYGLAVSIPPHNPLGLLFPSLRRHRPSDPSPYHRCFAAASTVSPAQRRASACAAWPGVLGRLSPVCHSASRRGGVGTDGGPSLPSPAAARPVPSPTAWPPPFLRSAAARPLRFPDPRRRGPTASPTHSCDVVLSPTGGGAGVPLQSRSGHVAPPLMSFGDGDVRQPPLPPGLRRLHALPSPQPIPRLPGTDGSSSCPCCRTGLDFCVSCLLHFPCSAGAWAASIELSSAVVYDTSVHLRGEQKDVKQLLKVNSLAKT